jgi:hypothetical protein
MPEGPEVETEKLHEAIHEELEKEGGTLIKGIAITTSLLAALAALASLQAGATVNQALALKTEATRLQGEASDTWAYYQAKGIKAAVLEGRKAAWEAAGKEMPGAAALEEKVKAYGEEQKEIGRKAEELQKARDEREEQAEHLLHHHHRYALAVALFQVSIALGAVAALTRLRPVWLGSILVGAAGLVSAVLGLL